MVIEDRSVVRDVHAHWLAGPCRSARVICRRSRSPRPSISSPGEEVGIHAADLAELRLGLDVPLARAPSIRDGDSVGCLLLLFAG